MVRTRSRAVRFWQLSLGMEFYSPGLDTMFVKTDVNLGTMIGVGLGDTEFPEEYECWVDKDSVVPTIDWAKLLG